MNLTTNTFEEVLIKSAELYSENYFIVRQNDKTKCDKEPNEEKR